MRVLVVEDERRMAELLRRGLAEEGFAVDLAASGEDGLWYAGENDYDAILLDVILPGIDGFTVLERLRTAERWGRGFPAAVLGRAFEPFASSPVTPDGRVGAGLGLAIVSAVTEAHGGHVSAANPPTGGARVELVVNG